MSRLVTKSGLFLSSNTAKVLVAQAAPPATWFPGFTNDWLMNALGANNSHPTNIPDPTGGNTGTVTAGELTFLTNQINGLGATYGDGSAAYVTLGSSIACTHPFTLLWVGVSAGAGKVNVPVGGAGAIGSLLLHYSDGNAYAIADSGQVIDSAVADAPTGPHWEYFRVTSAGVVNYASSTQTEIALEGGTDFTDTLTILYLLNRVPNAPTNAAIGNSEIVLWPIDIGSAGVAVNHTNLQQVYGFA